MTVLRTSTTVRRAPIFARAGAPRSHAPSYRVERGHGTRSSMAQALAALAAFTIALSSADAFGSPPANRATATLSGPVAAPAASAWVEGHGERNRVIAGALPTADGIALYAGIEMQMQTGWKTYWRNPGDDGGIPPFVSFEGSRNLTRAELQYPVPSRLVESTGTSYGYKGMVVFPIRLEAQDPSQPIDLRVAFEFGICKEICVPAEAAHRVVIVPEQIASMPATLVRALDAVPRSVPVKVGGQPVTDVPLLVSADVDQATKPASLKLVIELPDGETWSGKRDGFLDATGSIMIGATAVTPDPAKRRVVFSAPVSFGPDVDRLAGETVRLTLSGGPAPLELTWQVPPR
ncbi:MAG: protein-disulfide reductase DsbD domain-containing protein [Hyphomicrobiaceae bacterium]